MSKEYVGAIVLDINGIEVECKSLNPDRDLKRKAVPTMNRDGRARGKTRGVREYNLTLTAPVQSDGYEIDWDNIEDATLNIYDLDGNPLEQYRDVFTKKVGTKYELEGDSVHDVEMGALDHTNLRVTILISRALMGI